jgi:hypothetical protein
MKRYSDAERLKYIAAEGSFDGFVHVDKDRHEYAADVAEENGREEANAEDEYEGFLRLIDAAITADK